MENIRDKHKDFGILLEQPPLAQERLGHKDITTTMNIYSHVLPSSAREAAEKIGQLVYFSDAG